MCSYDALASSYFKQLVIGFQKADTVVKVFDRYDDDNSVKTAELNRSAAQDQQLLASNVVGGRPVPPWKRLLMSHPTSNHYRTFFVNMWSVIHLTGWKHTQPVHFWLLEASPTVR